MVEIEKPRIECVEQNADLTYGKFVVEPLQRGYGITIGNSLRRILLSSLPGAAVTSIKVDGTPHEFSTIPGVVEDVTQIILNIKGINLKLHSVDSATMSIDSSEKGTVCAKDIIHDSTVEILNPEHHIATLNGEGRLHIEMVVGTGTGWRPAEKNKNAGAPFGTIAVDSIFAPVPKVNFIVEDTRVGNITDFNKLTLEVWTNGAMTPMEAVSHSARILIEQFKLFTDLANTDDMADMTGDTTREDTNSESSLDIPIEEMDLSVRSFNCLMRAGINTVGDLVEKTDEEMLKFRNLGKKSYEEVIQKLANMGLSLKPNDNK